MDVQVKDLNFEEFRSKFQMSSDSDQALCSELHLMREEVTDFARKFPPVPTSRADHAIEDLLVPGNAHLIRYIGCLAQGGKESVTGWRNLLKDTTCRHGLVTGIVGRALREHISAKLYFGAPTDLRQKLEELEQEQVDQDGALSLLHCFRCQRG